MQSMKFSMIGALLISQASLHADVTQSATEAYEVVHFAGEFPSKLYRQAIDGNTMVVYTDGIRVFSIDDPTSPVELGSVIGGPQGGFTNYPQIDIDSNWVAVNEPSLVTVYDISDPTMPTISSSHPSGGFFTGGVEIHGDMLYYASAGLTNPGIQMIDLSVPGGSFIGVIPGTESVTEFTIDGSILYAIHDSDDQFRSADIQDPFNPVELSSIDCDVDDGWWDPVPYGFGYDAGLVSLQTNNGLELIDYSDPMNPVTRSVLSEYAPFQSRALGSVLDGNMLYASGVDNVIGVYDVGNVTAPIRLNEVVIPYFQYTRLARTSGGVMATGLTDELFYIQDTAPDQRVDRLVGEVDPDDRFYFEAQLDGSRLYATSSDGSTQFLNIFNLDDPEQPVFLASHQLSNQPGFAWKVQDDVFYMIQANANRIFSYDVSDPQSLVFTDFLSGVSGESMILRGDYIFAQGPAVEQIRAINISAPSNMFIASTVSLPFSNLDEISDMRISGNRLAITSLDAPSGGNCSARVSLVDVSNPDNMLFLSNQFGSIGDGCQFGSPGGMLWFDQSSFWIADTLGNNNAEIGFASWVLNNGVQTVVWDQDFEFIAQYGAAGLGVVENMDGVAIAHSRDNYTLFVVDTNNPDRLSVLSSLSFGAYTSTIGAYRNGLYYSPSQQLGIKVYQLLPSIDPCSPADLNSDGAIDFFDVSAFLVAYQSQDPSADFTGDGSFNFFDVSAFLTAFNAGCP